MADEEGVAQRHLAGVAGDDVQPDRPDRQRARGGQQLQQSSSTENVMASATTSTRPTNTFFGVVFSSAMSWL